MQPMFRIRHQLAPDSGPLGRRVQAWRPRGLATLVLCLVAVPALMSQCVPPPAGTIVAWYPFDESIVAVSAIDLAARNDAFFGLYGSFDPVPGMVGGATNFSNGFNPYSFSSVLNNFGPAATTCSGGDFSSCTGNFTIELWMLLDGTLSQPMAIVDKRVPNPTGSGLIGYLFYFHTNRIGLQLADGTGATGYTNYEPRHFPFTFGVWHHVAVVVNRSKAIAWYFDGSETGYTQVANTGSLVNTTYLSIGAVSPAFSGDGDFINFLGAMDELTIYNRALTSTEIQSIYAAGANGKCKP